jgi:dynein heavy chain
MLLPTVSRCGMVYMEPGAIGNEPLVKSWMNNLPESFKLRKSVIPTINELFNKYLYDLVKYSRKNCPEPDVSCDNNKVQSCFRLLDCYFSDYVESEIKKVTAEEIEDFEASLEQIFIFCIIWSIGATCTLEGQKNFNNKIRPMLSSKCGMPDEGMVYDYVWDKNKKEWQKWTEIVDEYFVDRTMQYSEIVVPTFDSIRMQYIKKILLLNKFHVMCPGPTGTGKTANISLMLATMMPEEYQYIPITFSA